jgi:hypothetical protein
MMNIKQVWDSLHQGLNNTPKDLEDLFFWEGWELSSN